MSERQSFKEWLTESAPHLANDGAFKEFWEMAAQMKTPLVLAHPSHSRTMLTRELIKTLAKHIEALPPEERPKVLVLGPSGLYDAPARPNPLPSPRKQATQPPPWKGEARRKNARSRRP